MEKQNSLLKILVFGIILALFLLVGQSYMLTKKTTENDVISVSGKSEMNVAPDKAEIYLSITTTNVDSKIAQQENKELSAKVIEALKNQGIAEKDIQTTNYRIAEKYNYYYTDDKVEKPTEYQAVHTIKISTTNLDKIGSLVDIAIENGANGIDSINYILSDELEKSVRDQALEKAIIAGKEKATSMAKTLNVKVGDVKLISENNYYYTPYTYNANVKLEAGSADSDSFERLNYLSPEEVIITSSVNLEFEIK